MTALPSWGERLDALVHLPEYRVAQGAVADWKGLLKPDDPIQEVEVWMFAHARETYGAMESVVGPSPVPPSIAISFGALQMTRAFSDLNYQPVADQTRAELVGRGVVMARVSDAAMGHALVFHRHAIGHTESDAEYAVQMQQVVDLMAERFPA